MNCKFLGQRGLEGLKGKQNILRQEEVDKWMWNTAWKPTLPLMWMLGETLSPLRKADYNRKSICMFPLVLKVSLTETLVHFPSTPNFWALLVTFRDPNTGSSEKQKCVGAQRIKHAFFPLASPAPGAVDRLQLQRLRAAAVGQQQVTAVCSTSTKGLTSVTTWNRCTWSCLAPRQHSW